jgi:iron complex transport system permease protein
MKKKSAAVFTLFALLLLAVAVCPMVGPTFTGWHLLFSGEADSIGRVILVKTRIPRLLLSILVGSALACSGAVFQSVFRNALATPFTLGTASGGAFGAVLAIKFGFDMSFLGFSSLMVSAFLGALTSIVIVYILGRHRGGLTTSTMLLAGVTIGFFFTAMTMFFHYIMDYTQSHRMLLWTMGSLDITEYSAILKIGPVVLACLSVLVVMGRHFNQICLGEEMARSRGVNVERVKKASFLLTSLMIGAAVSVSGPIGFVGLIVPHILRLIIGGDYRVLLPSCILGGGAFLLVCDTLARTVISPAEVPVGVITAMVGGPFFLFLLVRKTAENF